MVRGSPFLWSVMKFILLSSLLLIIVFLSYQLGKYKSQLKQIKKEKEDLEREIVYVQETVNIVHSINSDSINDKLQQISNKKK